MVALAGTVPRDQWPLMIRGTAVYTFQSFRRTFGSRLGEEIEWADPDPEDVREAKDLGFKLGPEEGMTQRKG
jgi:hypothetical protein